MHQRAAAGEKLHLFEPSPYLFFSVHLDGLKHHHDKSVCTWRAGSRRRRRHQGRPRPRASPSTSIHDLPTAIRPNIAACLDLTEELGVGVSISPATPMSAHPTRTIPQPAPRPRSFFASVRARQGKAEVHAFQPLPRLPAATRPHHCTPWGMPTRKHLRLQKPCYLLGEGYAKTFTELMETTDWISTGPPLREVRETAWRIAATSPPAHAAVTNPFAAHEGRVARIRTDARWRPRYSLDHQRRSVHFSEQVQQKLSEIRQGKQRPKSRKLRQRVAQRSLAGVAGRISVEISIGARASPDSTAPKSMRPSAFKARAASGGSAG